MSVWSVEIGQELAARFRHEWNLPPDAVDLGEAVRKAEERDVPKRCAGMQNRLCVLEDRTAFSTFGSGGGQTEFGAVGHSTPCLGFRPARLR